MLRRRGGHRNRGSSSSGHSRRSQSREGPDLNPHSEDSMALSRDPAPSWLAIYVTSTNGTVEVLRRHATLLGNLVTKISGGHHNKRHVEGRRHSPSRLLDERNKRNSANLPYDLRPQDMWELGVILSIEIEMNIKGKVVSNVPTNR